MVHVTHDKFGCYIGSDITIGHGAIIHACTLEDGCFIGMGATVMDGVVVESRPWLRRARWSPRTSGSSAGELWAGSPARFLRHLTREELAGFPRQAAHYAELARRYKAG